MDSDSQDKMEDGLLSLRWNNHNESFLQLLSMLRRNAVYADATLACEGKFFPIHKFVLSTCSEYFKEIFQEITSTHLVVVLKDIRCSDLESLLDYMYLGEVDVRQKSLPGLVKAAECLQIKGLVAADTTSNSILRSKYLCAESMKASTKRSLQGNVFSSSHKKCKVEFDVDAMSNLPQTETTEQLNAGDFIDSTSEISREKLDPVYVDNIKIDPEEDDVKSSLLNLIDVSSHLDIKYEDVPNLFREANQNIGNSDTDYLCKKEPGPSGRHEDSAVMTWIDEKPYDSIFEDQSQQQQMVLSQRRFGVVYQCLYCIKRFRDKTKWTTHSRTHTGEKPFQCPYCSYKASIKANVNRHIANIHYNVNS